MAEDVVVGGVRQLRRQDALNAEVHTGVARCGICDVPGGDVDSSVVQTSRQAAAVEIAVVVGGAAGGFEDGRSRGPADGKATRSRSS